MSPLHKIISIFFFLVLSIWQTASKVSALTITPSLTDISVQKGERVGFRLRLTNEEQEAVTVLLESVDVGFTVEGIPQFLSKGNIAPDSLVWWLSYEPGPYTLASGEEREIPITMLVPDSADAGGHYGAILVSRNVSDRVDQESEVKLQSKVASLLFVNVEGRVDRSFSVMDFASTNTLFESVPVFFEVQLSNHGNTHLQPHGTIDISGGLWPAKTKERLLVNEDFAYVLPGLTRTFSASWQPALTRRGRPPLASLVLLGKYTARLQLVAEGTQAVEDQLTFWIVPYKLIALAIVSAVVVIIGLWLGLGLYRRRILKGYKARP